jgi:membrane-associated phospholipid phosphatase
VKKIIILAFLLVSFIAAARCEDTIWNRVFFLDFQYMGQAIIDNPVKTGLIAGGFGVATYLLMKNDLWLSQSVRSIHNDFNDAVFNVFNNAGDGVYVLAADTLLFSLGGEKEKKTAVKVVEGLAVSGVISYAGKVIFGRERPSATDNPGVFNWFNFSDNSYPSGHTTVAFAWATIIGDTYDIGWITYPVAALTGIARIYRQAHWASDVLLGAFIGVITGKIVNYEGPDVKISAVPGGLETSYKF